MTKDPVCRMTISDDKATEKAEYKGKTYYFCGGAGYPSAGTPRGDAGTHPQGGSGSERFEKDPEKYLPEKHLKDEADWIKG